MPSSVGLRPTPRLGRLRGPVAPRRSLAGRAVRGLAVLARNVTVTYAFQRASTASVGSLNHRRAGRVAGGPAGAALIAVLLGAVAAGQTISREEALAAAFPGASIRAEQVFLTPAQQRRAADLAGVPVERALIARYIAERDGRPAGRAYVDTHVVRTKRESLLISLDAEGRVKRVDVTAFLEPPEYQAPGRWIDQYRGRALDEDLEVSRAIRPLAGATLTARATNDAVRRVLALDAVLRAEGQQERR